MPRGSVEVIVVDDGHDDPARDVCDGAAARGMLVRYERSERGPGAGPAPCRNQGVRTARSEFVFLLDDDDTFLPRRFAASVPLLAEGYDLVLEPSLRVHVAEPSREAFVTGPYGEWDDPLRFLIEGGPPSHVTPGATSFRKSTFVRAGGYDDALRYGEDGELLLRMCLHGRVALVGGEPVVRIAIHADNSTRPDRLELWQNIKALARFHRKVRSGPWRQPAQYTSKVLAGKLDYVLTQCRLQEPGYASRIRQGLLALRYFDWRCTTANNLKSIVVWLAWRRAA